MQADDERGIVARAAQPIANARAVEQGAIDRTNQHNHALQELFARLATQAYVLAAALANELEASEGYIAA
jgi:hypothetical protein